MSAGQFIIFSANSDAINIADIIANTVKVALVDYNAGNPIDSSETGDTIWSDVSSEEIANGYGYTTGGTTLTTKVINTITDGFSFSSDNALWTASGGAIPSWRSAVMYISGTLWGKTNPLIGYFLGNSSDTDIASTSDSSELKLFTPSEGWFTKTAP